mmetsp:Transcript_12222/g.13363  ORF Transcript_12222/g.13363 Transcript_12222/m.13363 type:complete len:414 (-) Transcript_12222:1047-2288(-)
MKISKIIVLLLIVLVSSDVALAAKNKSHLRHHNLSAPKNKLIGIPMNRRQLSEEQLQKKIDFVQESQRTAIHAPHKLQMVTIASTSELTDVHKLHITNIQSTEFTATIGVGNPRQDMEVILDTGSSNIWVNSKICLDNGCQTHTQYDHNLSTSFRADGTFVQVSFGSGPLQGEVNYDSCFLGDLEVKEQAIGEIKSEQIPVFDFGDFSGIVGLGFLSLATENTKPLFDTIEEGHLLEKNMFTFYLPSQKPKEQQFMFGEIPSSDLFQGELKWVDVTEQYYWTGLLTDIKVDGESVGACTPNKPCSGVVDSGTSLNTAPSSHVSMIVKALGVDSCYSGQKIEKSLSYCFGEHCFELKPEDYLLGGEGSCDVGLMAMDVMHGDQPLLILGDVFMMKFMVVFDKTNAQMGMAPYAY